MSTKYNIGDELWRATFDSDVAYVVCPDCGGTRFMTVRLFDGTEHTIDCRTCERGFDGSQGRLQVYDRTPCAKRLVVTSIEVEDRGTRYNYAEEYDLFFDEADALARAQVMCDDLEKAERDSIQHKEKNTKSWAWNATYHRQGIRQAQRSLEYHTSKLDVAKVRAKETKKAEA